MRDGLLHHGRVHNHLGQAARLDRAGGATCLDGLGQQPLHALFADPAAPAAERGGVNGQPVLKECLAGEVLVVRVLHPAGEDGRIGEAISVLQIHQACDQARRQSGPPLRGGEEARPVFFEPGPVDQRRQPDQLVPPIDHVEQARPPQVILFGWARTVLHGGENRRVCRQGQPNLAIPQHPIWQITKLDQRTSGCSRPTLYTDSGYQGLT
jgi:hypothetical protein